jgi:recombinational DNA repair protein (RecF pathway)
MPEPVWEVALLAGLRPVGDNDVLVDLFTGRDGSITLLAKGMSKPGSHLAPLLKPADELRIGVLERRAGRPLLAGCVVTRSHPDWQANLDHLALYWFMLESARFSSSEASQNADVLRLVVNLLRSEPKEADLCACLCSFCLKLLRLLGLLPDLESCSRDGHAFTPDEPVFLLIRGEGLIGRDAYNNSYSRATGGQLEVPRGLLRICPQRRQRWVALLQGPLLEYRLSSCDVADAAVLSGLCSQVLAGLAGQSMRSGEFLARQWSFPTDSKLAELLQ